ncbi:MAG: hypothetical protein AB8C84_03455 [Oligoflexales bacterium]
MMIVRLMFSFILSFVVFCSCKPLVDFPWMKKPSNPDVLQQPHGELFLRLSSDVLPQKDQHILIEKKTEQMLAPLERVYLLVDIPLAEQADVLKDVLFPSPVEGKGQSIIAVDRRYIASDEKLKKVLPESYQLEALSLAKTKQVKRIESIRDIENIEHQGVKPSKNDPGIYAGVYRADSQRGRVLYFEEISTKNSNWLQSIGSASVNTGLSRVMQKLQLDGKQADALINAYKKSAELNADSVLKDFQEKALKFNLEITDPAQVRQFDVPSFQHVIVTRLGTEVFVDRWFAYTFGDQSKVTYASAYYRMKVSAEGDVVQNPLRIQYKNRTTTGYDFQVKKDFQDQMLKTYRIAPHLQYGDRDYAVALTFGGQVWHGFRRWAYRHRWLLTLASAGVIVTAILSIEDLGGGGAEQVFREEVSLEESCMAVDWSLPECEELLLQIQESYGGGEENSVETDTDRLTGIPLPTETGGEIKTKEEETVVVDVTTTVDSAGEEPFEATPVEGSVTISQDAIGFLLNASTGKIDTSYRLNLVPGEYQVTGFFLKAN